MAELAPFDVGNNPNVRVLEGGYKLKNLKELLSVADEQNFGIPACNARSKWIAEAILDAAWAMHSPMIIEIAESETKYCPMSPAMLSDIVHEGVRRRIKRHGYSVPVCLHHDHIQKDVDGCVQRSIDAGFSSLEVDLSKQPIEENIKKCVEVRDKIYPLGISLEVEEGEIGAAEALSDPDVEKNIEQYYTKTENAVKLVESVKPNALAFFVGNGHGIYLKEPHIGYDRIEEICDRIRPMDAYGVLHGGSGISPEMFKRAVLAGARKFNYATALQNVWFKHFPQNLLEAIEKKAGEMNKPFRKVLYLFEDEVAKIDHTDAMEEITEHMKMMIAEAFMCDGKAELYR